jgi:hypothetical protein
MYAAVGGLHHVEIWVTGVDAAAASRGWLLAEFEIDVVGGRASGHSVEHDVSLWGAGRRRRRGQASAA